MKNKSYPIQIWFLSEDLSMSAQFLNDKYLAKNITGCLNALTTTYMYFFGIRNNKFYKHYFSKENKDITMDKFFPLWPLNKQPSFQTYTSKASKWCRKCKEHFDYVKQYLYECCQEYEFRFNRQHSCMKFLEWIDFDAPKINIPIAKLKKIDLEWKSLNPKYRKKDIVEGYRLQYKSLLSNYGIKIDDFSKRDIPEWLMEKRNDWLN